MTPRLMVITDVTRSSRATLLDRIANVCRAAAPGSVVVQLRDKQLETSQRLALGRALRDVTRAAQQALVVNDRLDLALALGADGVQLSERSVSARDARAVVGPAAWLSCSCHDLDRVVERAADADAVVLSPIVVDRKGNPALGFAALRAARANLDALGSAARLFALGGVDDGSARDCLEAGAHGVAAIGALLDVPDPGALLSALGIRR